MITLSQSAREHRLTEFIAQEEARGIGPAPKAELDAALSRLIKAGKSGDQTSRSASSDGSIGKRTR